jgi:hypothetical protein
MLILHSPSAGLSGSHESFDEGSIFESIPQDFVCPLTRQLFEDPVTLETGQTFEREGERNKFKDCHFLIQMLIINKYHPNMLDICNS